MTEHDPPTPALQRAAPAPLWRAMQAFLELLFSLFGDPSWIAARGVMGRRDKALMRPWLRAGEAFLRRLLLIEAFALAPDMKIAAPKRRAHKSRLRRPITFYPDKPEDWRVSFRLFPTARRRSRAKRRMQRVRRPRIDLPNFLLPPKRAASEFAHLQAPLHRLPRAASLNTPCATATGKTMDRNPVDPWPMAERLEALRRACVDPRACARRLARTLHRDERRAFRVLRREPPHIANLFGAQDFGRCNAIVASRRRGWDARPRADTS